MTVRPLTLMKQQAPGILLLGCSFVKRPLTLRGKRNLFIFLYSVSPKAKHHVVNLKVGVLEFFIDRRLCRVTGSAGVLRGGFFRFQKRDRASSDVSEC